jgi:glycosyltransferase involved in cell wall biosynthesis
MPRLLYFVNIPRFFYTHRLPLALAAQAAGYDVHITTSSYDTENVERIQATGLPYHPLAMSQHGTNPLNEVKALQSVISLYRKLKPDIVHQVSIKPVLYGGLAARWVGIPAMVSAMSGLGYVFVGSGTKPRLIRPVIRPLLKTALGHPNSRMIFQNPDDQALFIRLGLIDASRTILIRGSGVDTSVFVPQPEPDDTPIVLFAGRLMWPKGLGEFVEAARRLKGKARFVVVGYPEPTSPDSVPLGELETWQRDGLIEWWGKRDDMPQVYAQSHIVCLPSTYGEGVPKVLIEAAACGRPIVTTDTPGCREIARAGKNALLVPASDVKALTSALDRLIQDGELRRSLGAKGRQIAESEFSLTLVNAATLGVYAALLQK